MLTSSYFFCYIIINPIGLFLPSHLMSHYKNKVDISIGKGTGVFVKFKIHLHTVHVITYLYELYLTGVKPNAWLPGHCT